MELFIAESHKLLEFTFYRELEYRELENCWRKLTRAKHGFELRPKFASDVVYGLSINFDATANYVEAKTDQTKCETHLIVADDWISDVLALWAQVVPNSDPYSNHSHRLGPKKENRGSTRKGVCLQVAFGTKKTLEVPYLLIENR